MIDPVIFSFKLFGGLTLTLRWYGVLVIFGAMVGTWIAEKEVRRRGENGETIWDLLLWVLPIGIVGARLWYVANDYLGGGRYFIENPIAIINPFNGGFAGLHIFGGFLFGAIALLVFLRKKGLDVWLFLDAIAPAALIGQALARPANFINQELYGPETTLPWGIPIDMAHRLPQFAGLSADARFHPTFAYEMVWNILAGLFLWWYARHKEDEIKPGTIFGGWLVLAGIGRVMIEFFRPDQPKIPGTIFSYSALVFALMAVAGVILLLARYGKIQPAFAQDWEEEYFISEPPQKSRGRRTTRVIEEEDTDEEEVPVTRNRKTGRTAPRTPTKSGAKATAKSPTKRKTKK
jgi:phosphatidylglycerol:prolipoprotein diacylglycerol transferase